MRPPRVLTHSFPLYLPYLPQMIPCSYWTLTYAGVLSSSGALYMVAVRQARVSPPSFFRSHLTMDTLDLGYILPTAGRIRDFHPLERALTGRTATKGRPRGVCPLRVLVRHIGFVCLLFRFHSYSQQPSCGSYTILQSIDPNPIRDCFMNFCNFLRKILFIGIPA